tara:strand:- start:226 stop:798 length:573 start_codon:yes stop_codon:yes gene_type:complete
MGNRRMGLARMEALLEAVDRDLNLTNSTLTNCTITTSAAATFTGVFSATGTNTLGMLYATPVAKTADFTAEAGNIYLITKLDGCDVTLPAPTVGARIKLVFGGVTSNAHTVTADDTTTLYNGYALFTDAIDGTPAAAEVFAPDGTNDDVISLNGSTTGNSGIIELIGTATNRWYVEALLFSSGDAATPFA